VRILIVEDNTKLATSIRKGLEMEGYVAEVATDGITGEAMLESPAYHVDLVVLDIMLPGKDGIQVCKTWRRQGITVPVLMLTARDAVSDRVTGLDAGADDYLPKPFSFEELAARIRALLRRPQAGAAPVLTAGPASIDTSAHRVTVDGVEVSLTMKEYRLLELLARHPGQVLTREQIVDSLWGDEFDGYSNVVDVHVKNVRKKLDAARTASKDNKDGFIETIRGVGYRLKG